jgi:hypothetical protein
MARWLEGAGLLMMRLALGQDIKGSDFALDVSVLD